MIKIKFVWPFVVSGLVACSQMFSTYRISYDTDVVTNVARDSTVQISMRIGRNRSSSQNSTTVEISIVNLTDKRILWGRGSSSCKLNLKVIEGQNEYSAYIPRICTMDAGQYYLNPGESYTNEITWTGEVLERGSRSARSLSPGTYELIGVAGIYKSDPIRFTISSE